MSIPDHQNPLSQFTIRELEEELQRRHYTIEELKKVIEIRKKDITRHETNIEKLKVEIEKLKISHH